MSIPAVPSPPIITSSHQNPVLPGTEVMLSCTSSLEGAVYSWKRERDSSDIANNNQFMVGTNYLRIMSVDESLTGSYECTASADNNNIRVSSSYRLEVVPTTRTLCIAWSHTCTWGAICMLTCVCVYVCSLIQHTNTSHTFTPQRPRIHLLTIR